MTSLYRFKRKKEISFLWIIFLIFLFGGLGIFFIYSNLKIVKERKISENELRLLKTNLLELKRQKKEYLKQISGVEDPEYLEKVAREDFNLKKKDEEVISFPEIKEIQNDF